MYLILLEISILMCEVFRNIFVILYVHVFYVAILESDKRRKKISRPVTSRNAACMIMDFCTRGFVDVKYFLIIYIGYFKSAIFFKF